MRLKSHLIFVAIALVLFLLWPLTVIKSTAVVCDSNDHRCNDNNFMIYKEEQQLGGGFHLICHLTTADQPLAKREGLTFRYIQSCFGAGQTLRNDPGTTITSYEKFYAALPLIVITVGFLIFSTKQYFDTRRQKQ